MDKGLNILLKNRKMSRDFTVVNKYEAGISLLGAEVKAIKSGLGSLSDSFAVVKDNEIFLKKFFIPPYQQKNTSSLYEPERERKLLLNRKEIEEIKKELKQKTLTIVPFLVYNKSKKIKVEICLVKGKKKFDKRETIKKRDIERDLGRRLKN